MNFLQGIQQTRKRLTRQALSSALWQQSIGAISRRLSVKLEPTFSDLLADFDVIILKHCFPASDILEDIGKPDPASPRQSLENYKAIYRLLRDMFAKYPDTLFIIWTLPPRHRLFEPSEGSKDANAARATEFSNWLQGDFTNEDGPHPNIHIWDFRGLVTDQNNNFLKYEYELSHESPDSHPNRLANNEAGPRLARFTSDTLTGFFGGRTGRRIKIVFLHHSTGLNVYRYPGMGIPAWFDRQNTDSGIAASISHKWCPADGNMPAHYYRSWIKGHQPMHESTL